MINSMTAFACVQKQLDTAHLSLEIRSVNHRYLECSFRLPDSFRFLEPSLRNCLKNKLSRGKIECQLKYQHTKPSLGINHGMINALVELSTQVAADYQLANDLHVSQVLAWPDVVATQSLDGHDLGEAIIELFQNGLEELAQARALEGKSIKTVIEGKLKAMTDEVNQAKILAERLILTNKDKLLSRLHALKLECTDERVNQEIALCLTRMDVTEELDRLQFHLIEVQRILNGAEAAGRRLDFLMQELNREANTLSSKSDCVELTQSAVNMKVLVEQMREQIQNIE